MQNKSAEVQGSRTSSSLTNKPSIDAQKHIKARKNLILNFSL